MDKGQSKAFGPLPSGFDPNQGKSIYVPKRNLCGDDTDKQAEAVKALKDSYQKWREELEWLNLTGHSEDLEKTKKSLAEYAAKFKALGELGDANSALRARNEILADQEKAIIDADKAAQALLDTWAKSMKEFDAAVLAEANEGLKALSINLEGLGNVLAGDEWGEFEALAQKLAELREYYGALGDEDKVARIDALARAMGKLEDNSTWSGVWKARGRELEEFSLQAETARVGMGAMDSSIQLLSQGLAENLVGAITNTKTAFVDFGDIAKQILISLTAELIKMLALMAAMKIIKGIGLGAAAAATGGAAAPVVAGAGFVASGIDKVVRTPTAFVTGEAGAERVTVTPRARINRDNGGGGVTVVIQGDVYGAEKFNEAVATANRKVQYV
jgi:hypothetical protein